MLFMEDKAPKRVCIIIGTFSLYSSLLLSTFIIPCRLSCSAVIARYHHNSAPPYLGFSTEQAARSSFAAFQATAQLPQGLFFRSLRPLVGSPTPVQSWHPSTPQRRGMTPTSPTSRITPPTTIPRAPVRAASQPQNAFATQPTGSPSRIRPSPSPSLTQRNAAPAPAAARQPSSSRLLLAPVVENFYVVIEGDAPGVYGSQWVPVLWNGIKYTNLL